MATTLSGDLIPLIGSEVSVVTNGYGQLSIIGRLDRVGNDYILLSFKDDSDYLFELRVFFVNIIYVHANPPVNT